MKKIYILLLVLFCTIITTACGSVYKDEDITKTYSDYWKYSIGDFTYTVEDLNDNGGMSGGVTTTHFKLYTISFLDSNSNKKSFVISNDYSDFNSEIRTAAQYVVTDEIDSIKSKMDNSNSYGIVIPKDRTYLGVEIIDTNKKLYDPNNGVKLKDLKINNLKDNNLKFTVSVYCEVDKDIDEYPKLNEVLLKYVNYLLNNYDTNNMDIIFEIKVKDQFYRKVLKLDFNNNKYNWTLEYYDEVTKQNVTKSY